MIANKKQLNNVIKLVDRIAFEKELYYTILTDSNGAIVISLRIGKVISRISIPSELAGNLSMVEDIVLRKCEDIIKEFEERRRQNAKKKRRENY